MCVPAGASLRAEVLGVTTPWRRDALIHDEAFTFYAHAFVDMRLYTCHFLFVEAVKI